MLIPKLTVRRCVILGLMLTGLLALADGIARYELQQATGEMASVTAGAQLADASRE
ncbi:hypothetical protein [Methylobacterium sp. J-070]|uniref:hypothetical protein n=1 Tax=Methylobacterium sp. J-070 TaxID=2836650 RepID=UPI001FBB6872|nr:hypothetical protein [Methylobacterium sp. J-070]MCJ2048480.1 hypothetical protein [Methylobacterium sp. J-070]